MVFQDERGTISTILSIVRERTGADFFRFRPAMVQRRILNRMVSLGTQSPEEYLSLLRSSHEEAGHLLSRITIKVSRFYRNAASYDAIRRDVLPVLAKQAGADGLRIWSAGCGCGEEPYSLAMLLEAADLRGTVVGTDLDPRAIEAAFAGRYASEAMAELPRELSARYLTRVAESGPVQFEVRPALRARVQFRVLDLLSGRLPEDGMFDLICCRNVLIYYQPDMHQAIVELFRRALRPGGFLFLGEAEWPPQPHATWLECFARAARIFRAPALCLP